MHESLTAIDLGTKFHRFCHAYGRHLNFQSVVEHSHSMSEAEHGNQSHAENDWGDDIGCSDECCNDLSKMSDNIYLLIESLILLCLTFQSPLALPMLNPKESEGGAAAQ